MIQFIFNLIIKTPVKSVMFKVLLKLRNLLMNSNPEAVIWFNYKKFVLQMPFTHDYPINLKYYPNYSENLGKVTSVITQKYTNAVGIDVGANIGDSVAIIQSYTSMPILCIEGNSKFIPMLKENSKQFSNITIEQCFVGEANEKVVAINNLGTARLEKSNNGVEVKTMEQVLINHKNFQSAKLLKIDTDGFDNKIIRASTELLKTAKPILFFEYDPYFLTKQEEQATAIFSILKSLGYNTLILFDNPGNMLGEILTENETLLHDLTNYYNREGKMYMDICAIHEDDNDLIVPIKRQF